MTETTSTTTIETAETATAVEAAALLVSLAISGTHRPVEELGNALERLSRAAAQAACGVRHAAAGAAGAAGAEEQSVHDLAVCLESLQFHDRLMQQLSFVRDLLTAILKHEPLDMAAYGAPRWEALIALIKRRAPFDSRFELFDLLSPAEAREAEGSCELF